MDSVSSISQGSRGTGFHTAQIRSAGNFTTFDPNKVQNHMPAFIPFQPVEFGKYPTPQAGNPQLPHQTINIFA